MPTAPLLHNRSERVGTQLGRVQQGPKGANPLGIPIVFARHLIKISVRIESIKFRPWQGSDAGGQPYSGVRCVARLRQVPGIGTREVGIYARAGRQRGRVRRDKSSRPRDRYCLSDVLNR
jgi:hypothetical protein